MKTWIQKLFSRKESVESNGKPNGKDKPAEDPRRKNGSSVFCDPELQRKRDAEIEAVKEKSMESHRDLTETMNGFMDKKKGRSGLETPRA